MVRNECSQQIESKCIRGGNGEVIMHKLLNGADEMYGKGRMFNLMTLRPGVSIGEHAHNGDNEIFYILKGTAEYNDNGKTVTLNPGDVAVCNDGETHCIRNAGDTDLEMVALILYT